MAGSSQSYDFGNRLVVIVDLIGQKEQDSQDFFFAKDFDKIATTFPRVFYKQASNRAELEIHLNWIKAALVTDNFHYKGLAFFILGNALINKMLVFSSFFYHMFRFFFHFRSRRRESGGP